MIEAKSYVKRYVKYVGENMDAPDGRPWLRYGEVFYVRGTVLDTLLAICDDEDVKTFRGFIPSSEAVAVDVEKVGADVWESI